MALVLSGSARAIARPSVYHYVPTGSILELGGVGKTVLGTHVWPPPYWKEVTPVGGVRVYGLGQYHLTQKYTGSGELDIEATFVPVKLRQVITSEFTWHVLGEVYAEQQFTWNVGKGVLYYYQVEGECLPLTYCDETGVVVTNNDCKYQKNNTFMETMAATDLADLCTKLKAKKWNYPMVWPIKRIRKFSRPVYLDDIAAEEARGKNQDCQIVQDTEYCTIPECMEFCIDAVGVVRIGAKAVLVADKSYIGSGTLAVNGTAITKKDTSSLWDANPLWLRTSGSATVNGTWGTQIEGGGTISVGGEAVVTSPMWTYVPVPANLLIEGSYIDRYEVEGGGTVSVYGAITTPDRTYNFSGEGQISVYGHGTVATTGGGVWSGSFDATMGMKATLEQMTTDYLTELPDEIPIVVTYSKVGNKCGCDPISSRIKMAHNLLRDNTLTKFLNRNGFTLPDTVSLDWNNGAKLWRASYHFTGLGKQGSDIENWTILFEWGCVDTVGPEALSDHSWKLSIWIMMENQTQNVDLETRLLYTFVADEACRQAYLDFKVAIDAETGEVVTVNIPAYSDVEVITDELSIFRGGPWSDDSRIVVRVSDLPTPKEQKMIAVTPLYDTAPKAVG